MDRRVARTVSRIKQCFSKLLQQKDFADITIKMICDTADIERKTFYLHFKNKYDLLDSVIEGHFKAFRERVQQNPDATPVDFYRMALDMVDQHREIFMRIYQDQASLLIKKRIRKYMIHRLQTKYGTNDPAIQYFIAAGIGGVFESYVNGDVKGSKEQIARDMAWMVVQAKDYLKRKRV